MERKIIESDIRFRIEQLFKEADIVIVLPQRDIHLVTQKPLEVRMLKS
jgi:small-conductance mechanosensitive channel